MVFTTHLNKILRFIISLVFCTSIIYNSNGYASEDSGEELKEPPLKRGKLTKPSDSDEEIIHIVDPSAPKPSTAAPSTIALSEINTTTLTSPILSPPSLTPLNPLATAVPKKTLITDWFKAAPSAPMLVEEKVIVPESRPLKDSFHIFNVGQGNSQLAFYAEGLEEPFAVLYDGGTSAETVNSKVLKIQSANKESKPFLVRKTETPQISVPVVPSTFNLPLDEKKISPMHSEDEDKESLGDSSEGSDLSFSNEADTESPKTPIMEDMKDTLKKVKNLFVILSHPDKDHINLIKDSLSTTANVLFILCGNFFVENDKADLKTEINKLFNFISTRICLYPAKTHFTFPYFWPSEHKTPYSTLNYGDIKSFLSTSSSSKKLPLGIDTHLPEGFQGNFKTFLQRMQRQIFKAL